MAKPQLPVAGKLGKAWKITSPFGWRIHPIEKYKKHHNGVDIWGPKPKLHIMSWHDGRVIAAGTSKLKNADGSLGGVGWYVDVRSKVDGKWFVARYAHLVPNSLMVTRGQKIEAGTRLGLMGTSGASTGKHLHFEICSGKTHRWTSDGKGFIDPLKFVRATIKNYDLKNSIKQASAEDVVHPEPIHEPATEPTPKGKK